MWCFWLHEIKMLILRLHNFHKLMGDFMVATSILHMQCMDKIWLLPTQNEKIISLFSPQLENFINENVRSGVEEIKRTAVHTQTAAMLEMGTNLLSQSAEQTRKLTDVETQVSLSAKTRANLFAASPNEKLWGPHPCKNKWCHLGNARWTAN